MSEFIPINGHVQIEPLEQEGFVAESQAKYEEKGRVIAIAPGIDAQGCPFKLGDTVYFDSWLAAKLATKEVDKFLWVVKYEDVRGYESLSKE